MTTEEPNELYKLLNLIGNKNIGNLFKYNIHDAVFKKVSVTKEPGPTLHVVTLKLNEKEFHTFKWILQRALSQPTEGSSDLSVEPLVKSLLCGLAE